MTDPGPPAVVVLPGVGPVRVRPLAWGVVAALAGLVLWFSPVSPLALGRADVWYGRGAWTEALTHYDRIGRYNPIASVRVDADDRAATVAVLDLHDGALARVFLERLIAEPTAAATRKADAWERIGDLAWNTEHQPGDAAAAYQTAWKLDMLGPHAERRLIATARARTEAGDLVPALQAWERVAEHLPHRRGLARLNQASLQLASGEVEDALYGYVEVGTLTDDPVLLQAAKLGEATCRERLGQLDEALESLDAADLPESVGAERQRRLEERTRGR